MMTWQYSYCCLSYLTHSSAVGEMMRFQKAPYSRSKPSLPSDDCQSRHTGRCNDSESEQAASRQMMVGARSRLWVGRTRVLKVDGSEGPSRFDAADGHGQVEHVLTLI